jgi:hypothetical protein
MNTYADLQRDMASRGFTYTPINEKQFDIAIKTTDLSGVIEIAMDVGCGFKFGVAHLLHVIDKDKG